MDNNTVQVLSFLLAFAGMLLFSITICYSVKQVVAGKPEPEPQPKQQHDHDEVAWRLLQSCDL